MKKNQFIKTVFVGCLSVLSLSLMSCEKDAHKPPTIEFTSGTGYITTDGRVAKDSTINVSVKVTKVEDDIKSFNFSTSYDGAAASTVSNENIGKSEYGGFTRNVSYKTRSVAGQEKLIFTVTDADGNMNNKTLILTVN